MSRKRKDNYEIMPVVNLIKFVKYIFGAIVIVFSLIFLQKLLMPKYKTSFTMGALISEYYKQDKNHDVLFVGDCEICTAFSPPYLWEKYGINSYVRGSVQQTIWQTYYLLEEMLEEEEPKVVVFNVAAMKYEETYRSSYTRMTLDGMKWSIYKAKAVRESLTEEEYFIEYAFPILFYHSRWNELTKEDFDWFSKHEDVSFNGYLMLTGITPYEQSQRGINADGGIPFSDRCYEYLDMIRILCEKKEIRFVLIKGPGIVPEWYSRWDEEIERYAEEYNLTYLNLLERVNEIGIDYNIDTFSGGRHMNVNGAEKVSDYIGKILREEFEIPDRRGEAGLTEYWNTELIRYKEAKAY